MGGKFPRALQAAFSCGCSVPSGPVIYIQGLQRWQGAAGASTHEGTYASIADLVPAEIELQEIRQRAVGESAREGTNAGVADLVATEYDVEKKAKSGKNAAKKAKKKHHLPPASMFAIGMDCTTIVLSQLAVADLVALSETCRACRHILGDRGMWTGALAVVKPFWYPELARTISSECDFRLLLSRFSCSSRPISSDLQWFVGTLRDEAHNFVASCGPVSFCDVQRTLVLPVRFDVPGQCALYSPLILETYIVSSAGSTLFSRTRHRYPICDAVGFMLHDAIPTRRPRSQTVRICWHWGAGCVHFELSGNMRDRVQRSDRVWKHRRRLVAAVRRGRREYTAVGAHELKPHDVLSLLKATGFVWHPRFRQSHYWVRRLTKSSPHVDLKAFCGLLHLVGMDTGDEHVERTRVHFRTPVDSGSGKACVACLSYVATERCERCGKQRVCAGCEACCP